jgi:hypothetical protein
VSGGYLLTSGFLLVLPKIGHDAARSTCLAAAGSATEEETLPTPEGALPFLIWSSRINARSARFGVIFQPIGAANGRLKGGIESVIVIVTIGIPQVGSDPIYHRLLHQSANASRAFDGLFGIIVPMISVLLRILERIQPTLNILIRHRRLAEHPLELSLPCIGALAENRDFRVPLG